MPVAMAVGTAFKLNFEQRVFALGDMTLSTLQPRMSTLQRIGAGRMLLHREQGRLPPLHRVAR